MQISEEKARADIRELYSVFSTVEEEIVYI